MDILSIMNVTNRQSIRSDSGYVFYDLLAPHLTKEHNFTFVGPFPLNDLKSSHVFMDLGHNKYETRFSFPWSEVSSILSIKKPDVVMVNQIELLPNYKAVCMALDINPVLVGYSHYVPFGFDLEEKLITDSSLDKGGLSHSIRLNFLSGIEAADQVFIHSQTGAYFIRTACKLHGIHLDENKLKILPPPYDPLMLNDDPSTVRSKVVYNHRLYKHYGTESFINIAKKLAIVLPVDIHVFDILGQRSPERIKLDNSVEVFKDQLMLLERVKLINDGGDRVEYKKNLSNALCSVAPKKPTSIWAMSCIDSMGMGIPVVAPNVAWFAEFISKDLLFNSEDEAVDIIAHLYRDKDFWLQKSQEARAKIQALSPKETALRFLYHFEEALQSKKAKV